MGEVIDSRIAKRRAMRGIGKKDFERTLIKKSTMITGMTEELELKKEIIRTRRYLSGLEESLQPMQGKKGKSERATMTTSSKTNEEEFRKKFPHLRPRKSILALVGTEPRNPPSLDKKLTRQIVAERYE